MVIIIIGILSAIAIPVFASQRNKAVDAGLKSDARSVATQMELARTDDDTSYPSAITGTLPELVIGTNTVHVTVGNDVRVSLNAAGTAFCVQVTSPRGTDPVHGSVWQSDGGGQQRIGSDCSAYPTAIL